jgi:hypothetical protein
MTCGFFLEGLAVVLPVNPELVITYGVGQVQ